MFGSYVRGTFNEDSDIDIAVVLDDYDDSQDMLLELMKLRRKVDSRIEPHPFRVTDFKSNNPIVYEILKYRQELEN